MSSKIKELRADINERQARFYEGIVEGKNRAVAYQDAGYKTKNTQQASINAYRLLTKCDNGIAYLRAIETEKQRKISISRGLQLTRLDMLFRMAVDQRNVTAAKGVISEQNEMLGYHRENAPNQEREQARRAIKEFEAEELRKLCVARTGALAGRRKAVESITGDVESLGPQEANNG